MLLSIEEAIGYWQGPSIGVANMLFREFGGLDRHQTRQGVMFEVVCTADGSGDTNVECVRIDDLDCTGDDCGEDDGGETVKQMIAAYSEHEAFDGAKGGETHTIGTVSASQSVRVDAWDRFLICGIKRFCAWELAGLPAQVHNDCHVAVDTPLSDQAAFLYKKWATIPSVREDLLSRDLIVPCSEGRQNVPAQAAGGSGDAMPEMSADEREAGLEADRILRAKFSLDDEAIGNAKCASDGFYKWSTISKIARVGNPNFKKFKVTKKFTDRVPGPLIETCKRDGVAHMLSPKVAVQVLRMCDKV